MFQIGPTTSPPLAGGEPHPQLLFPLFNPSRLPFSLFPSFIASLTLSLPSLTHPPLILNPNLASTPQLES